MKRTLRRITAAVCAFFTAFGIMRFARADGQIKLTIWSYTSEFEGMLEKYYMPGHPDVDIDFVIYPSNEYEEKLEGILTTTSPNAPDLFVLDEAFAKKFINSDATGDLADIGITEEDTENVYSMILETGKSTKTQEQKALSWQANPTVLVYRASLAQEYLEVLSPEEFQDKVNSMDALLDTALTVADKSGGSVSMVSGTDDLMAIQYSDEGSFLLGDTISVSREMVWFTETMRKMRDYTMSNGGYKAWSPEWFEGMNGNKGVMAYIFPLWGLKNVMIPNSVEGWDYEDPDSEGNIRMAKDCGTYGDWRVVVSPIKGNWGGSYIATNRVKMEQASSEKKEAVRELISYMTLDENFLLNFAKENGVFVSNQRVNEIMADDESNGMEYLGGQNPYGVLDATAREIHRMNQSEYDSELQETWKNQVITPYVYEEKDLTTAISDFTAAVIAAHPGWTMDLAEPFNLDELEKLILPEDTTEIQANAFAGTDAEMIVVPKGISEIGSRAFADCARLKCLALPEGTFSIADDILEGCGNVRILCLPESQAEAWAKAHGFMVLSANE